MNRDMIPRIFSKDGVRYAAGYCGSGVVWARWAGQKAAQQVLGLPERGSPPSTSARRAAVPLFNGTPVVHAGRVRLDDAAGQDQPHSLQAGHAAERAG